MSFIHSETVNVHDRRSMKITKLHQALCNDLKSGNWQSQQLSTVLLGFCWCVLLCEVCYHETTLIHLCPRPFATKINRSKCRTAKQHHLMIEHQHSLWKISSQVVSASDRWEVHLRGFNRKACADIQIVPILCVWSSGWRSSIQIHRHAALAIALNNQ